MLRFHIDASHLSAATSGAAELRVGTKTFALTPHDTRTRDAARATNAAFALLPPASAQRFSHYVDVPSETFPENAIRWLRVVTPNADAGIFVPDIHLMSLYVPERFVRSHYLRKLTKLPGLRHPKLHAYGLTAAPADLDAVLDAYVATRLLVTAQDTAASFVAFHPELANVQPYTANVVMTDHIAPSPDVDPDQYNAISALQKVIVDPQNQPWSPVIPCTDKDGNPLTAGYAFDKIKPGQQLYTYRPTPATVSAALPAVSGAKRSAFNDTLLQNQTWSVQQGTAALRKIRNVSNGATGAAPTGGANPQYDWTLNELTPRHGLSVDAGSIVVDAGDNFSIAASNSYSRTLYAYYQLFDDKGKALGPKTGITSVSAVNTILGIPMPTDPTMLSFNLSGASSVDLLFGGFGTSLWDPEVCPHGALLTGLWQYGVPGIFLVLGDALTSTSLYNKIVNDKDLTAAAIAIGFGIVGGGVATAAALLNTKFVLISFADVVIGMIVQKGLEKLGAWITAQVGEGAISEAFGPVGWIFTLASSALDFEEIAVTTGELLSTPATLTVKVTRTMNVSLTLLPDPKHGEAGKPQTAVWPALAQHYLAILQYKDGTALQLTGLMPATTNSTPIALNFSAVPALGSGQLRILAGVYSRSGWLAGAWQSDWLTALPNSGDTLVLGHENITENLVPLSPDTQYTYKETIAYTNDDYVWQAGQPPTTTVGALGIGPITQLVDITLNNSVYQIGYAYKAANQDIPPNDPHAPPTNDPLFALQNLSVLADPGSRLKFSQIGFTDQPSIAYSPTYQNANQIEPRNYIVEPSGGTMQVRLVTLNDGEKTFGLTGPDLQSWGQFPLPSLDAVAVHTSSDALVAVSWQNHKMMLLPLPKTAVPDAQAEPAVIVSGQGIRQGLMQGPRALAIAPDGRILILETINERIQAFDIKGNPVASFLVEPKLFSLARADVASDLDAGRVPPALQQAFQTAGVTFLFPLGSAAAAQLDSAKFQPKRDPIIAAFAENGVVLSYIADALNDRTVSSYITVVTAGTNWTITDPGSGLLYQIVAEDDYLAVYRPIVLAAVGVIQAGQQWVLTDFYASSSWSIQPTFGDTASVDVLNLASYAPLHDPSGTTVTYSDLAVEPQGNMYVLSYTGDGSLTSDYRLDVYAPNGTFLFRTPDNTLTTTPQNVVAGKLTVDMFRNVYTLDYQQLSKPGGMRPEPSVSHWMPTPPLFTLPLTDQPYLDQKNIGPVAQAFAENGITLSSQAFILVESSAGYYAVKDVATIYNVFRSGDGLQVYAIPA